MKLVLVLITTLVLTTVSVVLLRALLMVVLTAVAMLLLQDVLCLLITLLWERTLRPGVTLTAMSTSSKNVLS